ncbi:MAG: hypothetical protein IJM97_01530 [Clostridia bacterium]|nr:hypothetical protein [Clostridia bacterium]MBQ6707612.1 hypothetical protein [Clostridia bacterium]
MNNGFTSVNLSDEDLELINRFTKSPIDKDSVFTFSVVLCDNEVDRDYERFDEASLRVLAEMFVGKTGIFDHSMKSGDQVARVYATEVLSDSTKRTSLDEAYTFIKAKCYMPKTDGNSDLIKEIEAGIKKEVSISCSVRNVICSICGTDTRHKYCEHQKGKTYGGKICHNVLKSPDDAYEWSFVAVPAQRGAGVTKAYRNDKKEVRELENIIKSLKTADTQISLSSEEALKLSNYIAELERKSHDGQLYRESLKSEAIKFASIALPDMKSGVIANACDIISTEDLVELKSAFEKQAAAKMPVKPQFSHTETKSKNNNNEFKI